MTQRWKQAGIIGAGVSILLVVLLLSGTMAQTTLRLTDLFYVPQALSDQIVIIAIDDQSLSEYGRSPLEWDRTLHADLLDHLQTARVVAFDLLFIEQSEEDEIFARALEATQASENNTRIVMAQAGLHPSQYRYAVRYATTLKPVFSTQIDYSGYVTTVPDIDSKIRRHTSIVYSDSAPGQIGLNFAVAAYLAHRRIPEKMLESLMDREADTLYLTPKAPLPIDANGIWLSNFFGTAGTYPHVSYYDVIEGNVDDDFFTDKIVLIGMMNATGSADRFIVPISPDMPMSGIEIHANAIETLLQQVPLKPQSDTMQVLMVIALALFSSTVYTHLRWMFKLIVVVICIATLFAIASYLFSVNQFVINFWYALLALVIPLMVTLVFDTVNAVRKQERAELMLESIMEVSRQQLNPWAIHALIIKDIKKFFPNARVNIHTTTPYEFHQIRVPIVWHNRVLATITIDGLQDPHGHQHQLNLLHELIERIAPSLANAELYVEGQNQNDLLRTILRESPQGVVVLDEHQHIVTANRKFGEMVSDDDIQITLIEMLKKIGITDKSYKKLSALFEAQDDFQIDIEIEERTYKIAAAPMWTNSHWVVILADVSELVHLSQSKSRLLRVVSHDLKNPLTRINLYGSMIGRRDPLTPRQQDQLEKIMSAATDMYEIITELLDIEQVEKGTIEMLHVNLSEIAHKAIRNLQDTITHENRSLKVDITPEINVNGNARLLQQCIRNLLDNAAKYTSKEGEIRLRLWCEGTTVKLSVQDNGIGMSQEEQAQLFTEFYRVKNQKTANIPGTGLGLSLVKSVVKAHSGTITVVSNTDAGSTFTIHLPLVE